MELIKVLWTGGWDSTFRIVELSRQEVEIQPVYVIDPTRKSSKKEEQSMKNIVEALKNKKETKAKFLEIKKIDLKDIPQNEKITQAYKKINQETKLGIQHDWLARLGEQMPGMEMGTEYAEPETSCIINSIQKFAKMKFINGIGIIDKENSTEEANLVLGWFKFPIIQKTELDMLKLIKEWHYEDVMKLIWFCHQPIDGKPCGMCHPCRVKIESNMEFLLPKKAIKRYKRVVAIEKLLGPKAENLYIKVVRKLHKIKERKN